VLDASRRGSAPIEPLRAPASPRSRLRLLEVSQGAHRLTVSEEFVWRLRRHEMGLLTSGVRNAEVASSSLARSTTFTSRSIDSRRRPVASHSPTIRHFFLPSSAVCFPLGPFWLHAQLARPTAPNATAPRFAHRRVPEG
jgi:hypothetical protein